MKPIYKLDNLAKKRNGLLTTKDLKNENYNNYDIVSFLRSNILEKVGKGLYYHHEYLQDTLAVIQKNNNHIIFSNETSLYLLNLTDRFPRVFSATTYSGYHVRKSDNLKLYYINKSLLDLGVIEVKTTLGNIVKSYDKERTLCDIIHNKNRIEQQIYVEAIQNYFLVSKPNLNKLAKYARALGVSEKVNDIVTLYLKP